MGLSGGSQSSNSNGWGYGYNQSLAQSLSGQEVWGPQGSALANLYGQATGLANNQAGQVGAAANALNAGIMPQAQQSLAQASQFANPNSALAQQQTADLADTIGTQFGRTILPQITTGAGLGGNIGGSREALARGVAAGDAAKAIASAGTDFYSNAYNTAAQMAGQIPGMASQVFNLGMAPFQAQWAPLTSLAGILGGPTTLSRSVSQAGTQAENWNQQQATSKGNNWGLKMW